MFVDHTAFYDICSLKVSKTKEMLLLTGSPIAHFCFPQGGGTAHFGNHTVLAEVKVDCCSRSDRTYRSLSVALSAIVLVT